METRTTVTLDAAAGAVTAPPSTTPPVHPFGPEFEGPTPRTIHPLIKRGPYVRRIRRRIWVHLLVGVTLCALSFTPTVEEISYFFLPLGYLLWLGVAWLLITLFASLIYAISLGRFEAVVLGQPIAGRVLRAGWRHVDEQSCLAEVEAEFLDPKTHELTRRTFQQGPFLGKTGSFALKPGDTVTIVHQGNVNVSGQLYAFLELSDREVAFLVRPSGIWGGAWGAGAIVGLFATMILSIYTVGFYAALKAEPSQFIFPVVVWIACCVAFFRAMGPGGCMRNWVLQYSRPTSAGAVAFGVAMLAGLAQTLTNALLDFSPPHYREVEVVNFWQTTHKGIFREYQIEYRPLDGGLAEKYPAKQGHMEAFADSRAGVVEVHGGLFGWPWIRQIHPVVFVPLEEADFPAHGALNREDVVAIPEEERFGVTLAIDVDGELNQPSNRLRQHVWQRLREDGTVEGIEEMIKDEEAVEKDVEGAE